MINPKENDPEKLRDEISRLDRGHTKEYIRATQWKLAFWSVVIVIVIVCGSFLLKGCNGS